MTSPLAKKDEDAFSLIKSPVEDIVSDLRNGRMVVLVDDESRENEGDLVIPAQMATPDAINFMACHGRGLICLALTQAQSDRLGLSLMPCRNRARHQTAFTTSIEAGEGVTTGISAADRARTVAAAIAPEAGVDDIVTPGHIFPIIAQQGGVLERAGHTEASIDFVRMAGLNPSAVICEIINEDGTMARREDLIGFSRKHGLKIGVIADLIAARLNNERLVEKIRERPVMTPSGPFNLITYRDQIHDIIHIALVKGALGKAAEEKPTLVRMHALDLLKDVCMTWSEDEPAYPLLARAMECVSQEKSGAVIILRGHEDDPLLPEVDEKEPRREKNAIRYYGIGAQILLDLGINRMVLLSDTVPNVIGLEGFGISIEGRRSLTEGET